MAPEMEKVFTIVALIGDEIDHGPVRLGRRVHVPILGGQVTGPRLQGVVLPGGADWQIQREDGYFELEAIYDIQADNGDVIHVRNHALWYSPTGQWPATYAISQPRFDAPVGPNQWLNQSVFVAPFSNADGTSTAIHLDVYRVKSGGAVRAA